ncbi:MAG: M48 family metallopeptidase [Oscillospiraceae bacterium]|nr:M48 family metallopeptidase [Oscillospiraceae bacterium]
MSTGSYTLTRQRRRTIAITVDKDGGAQVRAPYQTPLAEIDAFVAEKTAWIEKQQARVAAGLTMDVVRGREVPLLPGDTMGALQKRHRAACLIRLKQRIPYFANLMGVTPADVYMSNARSFWGSCLGLTLRFSWRLDCADDAVFDYIVVHELAHIRMPNHSARFWAVVGGVLPDYAQRRKALRALQKVLMQRNLM